MEDNDNKGNADDAMMAAFEQYMMGGKNNEKQLLIQHKKEQQLLLLTQQELAQQMARDTLHKQQLAMKKAEKKYWHLYQTFTRKIKEDWLQLDDQSHTVLKAIVGIRSRLPMHTRLLERYQRQHILQKQHWTMTGYGFSGARILFNSSQCQGSEHKLKLKPKQGQYQGHDHSSAPISISKSNMIKEQDVELALSHDLIQHEKMMDGLRSSLANLSECHEALLRHLDVMTKHHSECLDFVDSGRQDGNDIDIGNDSGNGTSTASLITFTLDGFFASFEKAAGLISFQPIV